MNILSTSLLIKLASLLFTFIIILELYSYTEEPEFFLQKKAFEDSMTEYGSCYYNSEMFTSA